MRTAAARGRGTAAAAAAAAAVWLRREVGGGGGARLPVFGRGRGPVRVATGRRGGGSPEAGPWEEAVLSELLVDAGLGERCGGDVTGGRDDDEERENVGAGTGAEDVAEEDAGDADAGGTEVVLVDDEEAVDDLVEGGGVVVGLRRRAGPDVGEVTLGRTQARVGAREVGVEPPAPEGAAVRAHAHQAAGDARQYYNDEDEHLGHAQHVDGAQAQLGVLCVFVVVVCFCCFCVGS